MKHPSSSKDGGRTTTERPPASTCEQPQVRIPTNKGKLAVKSHRIDAATINLHREKILRGVLEAQAGHTPADQARLIVEQTGIPKDTAKDTAYGRSLSRHINGMAVMAVINEAEARLPGSGDVLRQILAEKMFT